MEEQKSGFHAIVAYFGHTKLAGYVDEYTIGGSSFMRITIPELPGIPSWQRMFTSQSVYSMDPCSEETANAMAARLKATPVAEWDMRSMMTKLLQSEGKMIAPESSNERVGEFMYGNNEDDLVGGEEEEPDGGIYDNDGAF